MIRLILKTLKLAIIVLATCVLVAWLIGQIFSDRYTFTQWLLWIPTPVAIIFALVNIVYTIPKKPFTRSVKMRFVVCVGITIAIVIYFSFVEHHFFRSSASTNSSFKIIHFNANTANDDEFENFNEEMLAQNADLIILTNSGHRRRYEQLTESYRVNGRVTRVLPFRIFSRFEILESRPIVSNQDISVVLLRLDATSKLGKEITIYAVDLPSDPKISRMQTAKKLHDMLNAADAPAPDVVIGDFNMTRRGAALKSAFPDLVHAYDRAGQGYGATFPRRFPLYHIDHILLAQTLQAQSYKLIDSHAGRHRMQIAQISAKD